MNIFGLIREFIKYVNDSLSSRLNKQLAKHKLQSNQLKKLVFFGFGRVDQHETDNKPQFSQVRKGIIQINSWSWWMDHLEFQAFHPGKLARPIDLLEIKAERQRCSGSVKNVIIQSGK